MASTHRAIRVLEYTDPIEFTLDLETPRPKITKPTDVLIAVAHAGVNPVDSYADKRGVHPLISYPLPYTAGGDGAGMVEAVGTAVKRFKAGDRVYFTMGIVGSFAEHTIVDEIHVNKLPETLTTAQGAAMGIPYFTAYRALFHRVHAKAGETVLIHGASGAVGVACIQIARAFKLNVIGTAGTPEGVAFIKSLGCNEAVNHRQGGYLQQIADLTAREGGVDIILEMASHINFNHDLNLIKSNGRICIIGSRASLEVSPGHIMVKEAVVSGVILPNATPAEWHEMGLALNKGMRDGWLIPQVDKVFPLAQAQEAIEEVMSHTNSKGKIVLNCEA
jgi:NADPH2:quinone reductase